MDDSLVQPVYDKSGICSELHDAVVVVYNLMLRNGSVYGPDEITIQTDENVVRLKRDNVCFKLSVESHMVCVDPNAEVKVMVSVPFQCCVIEEPTIHNKIKYDIPKDSWVLSRKMDEILY